ncbi:unnamed protein product [Adineta steineri]|nr:unnamed protein product [Adineta steineri]CAF4110201.1 unnamed protein product [Adineta steineri]CAF4123121.1 unnamed protein product [Adineta steineri]
MNSSSRFEEIQNAINDIIKSSVDNDSKTESCHYRQLLNNIICNNVCFNQLQPLEELEGITGAASLDVIVDKHMGAGERVVVVLQHVVQFKGFDVLIGVLVIGTKTNNRWFMIDHSVIKKKQGKVDHKWNHIALVVQSFQSSATALGAIKVRGPMAKHLLQYGQSLLSQTKIISGEKQYFAYNAIEYEEPARKMM